MKFDNQRAISEPVAASYIGIALARIHGKRDNRTPAPPFIKIGRAVRYLREDLDQWLTHFQKRQAQKKPIQMNRLKMIGGA